MGDSYQAIYDAVRSRIGSVNTCEVIERAIRDAFDISHTRAILQEQFVSAAFEMVRPSVLWRPAISQDGNKWCALYGEDLVNGVAGFGDTAEEAMREFDQAWFKEKTSAAARAAIAKATGARS